MVLSHLNTPSEPGESMPYASPKHLAAWLSVYQTYPEPSTILSALQLTSPIQQPCWNQIPLSSYFHLRHHSLLSIYIYISPTPSPSSVPYHHTPLPPLQPHPHTIHPRNKTPSDQNPKPEPHTPPPPPKFTSPTSQILHDLSRRSAFVCAWGRVGRCGFRSFFFFLRNLGRGGGERRGEGSCFPWGGGLGGFM